MPEAPQNVMIFAAGFGTRMGDLTKNCPKPLIRVADKALLDHALSIVTDQGKHAFVNAHYKAEQIVQHLRGRPNTTVLVEADKILETGGGLKNAIPTLGTKPVFTLNSDAIWRGPNPLQILEDHWDPQKMDALLLLIPQTRIVGRDHASGDFAYQPDGRIKRDKSGVVYTGAQILKTDLLAEIHDDVFSLNQLWDNLLRDGAIYGLEYPGKWADVGTPDGIGQAEKLIKNV